MSHRQVEGVIGRLCTDEALRRRFAADPAGTLAAEVARGVDLTPVERDALAGTDAAAWEALAASLDARLQRANLGVENES